MFGISFSPFCFLIFLIFSVYIRKDATTGGYRYLLAGTRIYISRWCRHGAYTIIWQNRLTIFSCRRCASVSKKPQTCHRRAHSGASISCRKPHVRPIKYTDALKQSAERCSRFIPGFLKSGSLQITATYEFKRNTGYEGIQIVLPFPWPPYTSSDVHGGPFLHRSMQAWNHQRGWPARRHAPIAPFW